MAFLAGGACILGGLILLAYSERGWSLFSQEAAEAIAHGLGLACIGLGLFGFSRLRHLELTAWDDAHPQAEGEQPDEPA